MSNSILVVFAHPAFERSRINRLMLDQATALDNVAVCDLYELYPDFYIDVAAEQQKLREHDIIVLQHPLYWYSCPALMKEWIDLVFEPGFAYGPGADALKGKWLLTATSAGGKLESYTREGHNGATVQELLLPFNRTATLCGMRYLPPFVVHSGHKLKRDEIQEYADQYGELLTEFREEHISLKQANSVVELNELLPSFHPNNGGG